MSIALPNTHRPLWPRAAVARAVAAVRRWWRLRREGWELLAMTDRELRDIGLSRTDARAIAGKLPWSR